MYEHMPRFMMGEGAYNPHLRRGGGGGGGGGRRLLLSSSSFTQKSCGHNFGAP